MSERLRLATRARSPRGAALAIVDAVGRRVALGWWAERLPWYAGRAVDSWGLTIRIDGAAFDLGPGTGQTVLKGLMWLGAYETLERYAIVNFLPRDLPVIEFGAAVGVVSCLTNSRLTDPTRHVVVEANPELIAVLERNRDRNGRRFRVTHAAVAYGCQSVEFGISSSIVLSSVSTDDTSRRVTVPAVSLERIHSESGFSRCSLVCDIEGAEADLISHEGHVLQQWVDTLVIEVHPGRLGVGGAEKLADSLRRLGFSPVWRRGDVWVLASR